MNTTDSTATRLDAIERTVELAHPVERVWRAVTDADELAAWFPNDSASLDVRPGGAGRFRWVFTGTDDEPGSTHTSAVTVHEVEAPTRFVWSWKDADQADPIETTVEFTLTARADGGTTLVVREWGFLDDVHRAGNTEGWAAETAELIAYLDGAA